MQRQRRGKELERELKRVVFRQTDRNFLNLYAINILLMRRTLALTKMKGDKNNDDINKNDDN